MTEWIKKGYYEKVGFEVYKSLPDYRTKYDTNVSATPSQLCFLMGLIKNYIFKDGTRINRVVEVGIYRGVSALYMLKAGTIFNSQYHQYDIEVEKSDFYGEVVKKEASSDELKHWSFMNGMTTFDIENILSEKEKIDMIFIDGAHAHPYPLIDLIMLLPYMRNDAIVCFHDVEFYNRPGELGGAYMYSGWHGEKYLNQCVKNNGLEPHGDESLGVLRLPKDMHDLYDNLVEIAGQDIVESFFDYRLESKDSFGGRLGISIEDLSVRLLPFMRKHYPLSFVKRFWEALSGELRLYQKHWVSLQHMNRLMYSYWQGIDTLKKRVAELELRVFRHSMEEKIPKGAKVAVFGAGSIGRQVYASLLNCKHCDVVAWVDNAYEHFGGEISDPNKLMSKKIDYILVAVAKERMRDEIFMQLKRVGYDEEVMIWVPNIS
ncbi:hypothetical protein D081_1060 [Anaerovibrio sp. JC8]|uniref:class I SAM-dependent methyltransferase n=1 Tax=Anaerovibrio sp. JC8 TaxID=1240085 RepID=UPI000A0E3EF6|nr:class I SAM-dependent methyltransferase [Anaerovibrio sp. JC8]ORU00537.1 hypothetical protein D081_1060 [Anaerovibrio sp. JC8]